MSHFIPGKYFENRVKTRADLDGRRGVVLDRYIFAGSGGKIVAIHCDRCNKNKLPEEFSYDKNGLARYMCRTCGGEQMKEFSARKTEERKKLKGKKVMKQLPLPEPAHNGLVKDPMESMALAISELEADIDGFNKKLDRLNEKWGQDMNGVGKTLAENSRKMALIEKRFEILLDAAKKQFSMNKSNLDPTPTFTEDSRLSIGVTLDDMMIEKLISGSRLYLSLIHGPRSCLKVGDPREGATTTPKS